MKKIEALWGGYILLKVLPWKFSLKMDMGL